MKQLLATICIGTVALAFTAQGAENDQTKKKKGHKAQTVEKASPTTKRTGSNAAQVRTQRSFSTARSGRGQNATVQKHSNVRNANEVRARNDLTVNRERNSRVNRDRNVAVNRETNVTRRNVTVNRQRNITVNRRRNVTITNNWRSERFSGARYAAFRNYRREWHDRDWWHSHHTNIVFSFGAPYYWNSGYWYPAWGYNPGYRYVYDGPIYGYNNLPPDQIVVNVQSQLQRDGYYDGPIDGLLGPMTREAIAAFQYDHGLAVTSAVDEPTLASLGLV